MIARELEAATGPLDALAALAAAPEPFLLESRLTSGESAHGGRWSFAGAWPAAVVEGGAGDARDPLERVAEALRGVAGDAGARGRARLVDAAGRGEGALEVPFAGGAVGFIGYDYGRRLERLPARAEADQRFPDVRFGVYRHVFAFDGETGRAYLAGTEEGFEEAWGRYDSALRSAVERRDRHDATTPGVSDSWRRGVLAVSSDGTTPPPRLERTFSRAAYERAVARAVEYIRAGDIFEVNLSQRFEARVETSPLALYARLREAARAPFAALLTAGDGRAVLSASPERYLALRGRRLVTEPIKGTRPRGRSPEEDARLAEELLGSRKDRAELSMIVDLARNDLGRVAERGTVRVERAAERRTFPTVHHLVGVVEAELREGLTVFDAVRASFPGGSITGAPKVRAMEVIEELEPTRRSVYTGALGWIGLDGDADLAMAIRTILLDGTRASFQAGGAVTAESEPSAEYDETIAKGRALARALGADLDALGSP